MQNFEMGGDIQPTPDLEHTKFIVHEIEEIEANGQKMLQAKVEEVDPMESKPKHVVDIIARRSGDGKWEIEDYFDHPEIRSKIDEFLASQENYKKAA